jgi:hypothetical protein
MQALKRRWVVSLVAGALAWLAAGELRAADRAGHHDRQGFMFGGSVSIGRLGYWLDYDDWSDSTTSLGLQLHLGSHLDDQLAVVLDSSGQLALGDEWSSTLNAAALQFWPTDGLWLRAGGGIGTFKICWDCTLHWGGAGLAAAGLEIYKSHGTVVDVNTRFVIGRQGDYNAFVLSIGLGVSFY